MAERLEARQLLAADLSISEFLADNDGALADGDGRYSDWIEIHNAGDTAADLQGWYLTDDPQRPLKWPFPDTSLAPDEYKLVFASTSADPTGWTDAGGYLHANFSLNANGEYLALVDATGAHPVIASAYGSSTANYPKQHENTSYGVELRQEEFVFITETTPVRATVPSDSLWGHDWTGSNEPFDDSDWDFGVNGVGYDTGEGRTLPSSLVGHWLLDETAGLDADDQTAGDGDPSEYDGTLRSGAAWNSDGQRGPVLQLDGTGGHVAVPNAEALDPHGGAFSVAAWINVADASIRQDIVGKQGGASENFGGWAFRISQTPATRNLNVLLNADNGANRIDVAGSQIISENEWHHVVFTYDGSGRAEGVSIYLDGVVDSNAIASGAMSLPIFTGVDMAIGNNRGRSGSVAFHGQIDDVSVWTSPLDVEQIALLAGGISIPSLSGYESFIDLDLQALMLGHNASAYVRIPFEVGLVTSLDELTLAMNYDDGFVAYLDGVEVARRNAPALLNWDSTSVVDRPDGDGARFEKIDVSAHAALLTPGSHVLAIQGLNDDVNSPEFLVRAELRGAVTLGAVVGFFATPTPGQPNGDSLLGFVADPQFSVDRGFYDSKIDVVIETETPDATIRYTTDGSAPTGTHGTVYSSAISIDRTTTLRAAAFRHDYFPSKIDTRTYVFRADVLTQTRPEGFPTETVDPNHSMDYEVDPRIAHDPALQADLEASLLALPSVSVVMDFDDLFATTTGIYPNSTRDGSAWQRPGSVEWIDPSGGDEFQIDVGINVSGRSSRTWSNTPKHNFRLKFSSRFGPKKLEFPLFEGSPVDEFDELVIRSPIQDSWTTVRFEYRENAQYSVDRWVRQTYRDMDHAAGYGRFAHLYLNGLYWGIYEVTERPNSEFAASHLGGDAEQYDALNAGAVKDGNADAWNLMHQIANGRGTFGSIADPAAYGHLQEYLDVEAFADYVIMNVYGANIDWPHNNYWAVRQREPGGKFQFIPWDSEHPLWESQWNTSEFGRGSALDYNVLATSRFRNTNSGAGYLYQRLKQNESFRLLMADRLQEHLTHGGVLTPEVAARRFQGQLDHVAPGMIAESARWGDAWGESPIDSTLPFSRDVDWANASDWLINDFFPDRTKVVLKQFVADGIDPGVPPAEFNQHGGLVDDQFPLEMAIQQAFVTTHRAFVTEGAPVRAFVPPDDSLDVTWFAEAFVPDATWTDGSTGTGVGYRDGATATLNSIITTDVQDAWDRNESSLYARIEFDADLDLLGDGPSDRLLLRMKYDDGFVAFLNGVEIARSDNVPDGTPTFNTLTIRGTTRSTSAVLRFVDFDITEFQHLLRDETVGTNLLAIQGLNSTTSSNDLLVLPELVAEVELPAEPIIAPIYFTLDGVDPRAEDGDLNPSAAAYTGPVSVIETMTVKARVKYEGVWSALTSARFTVDSPLAVTEIMYHPAGQNSVEFIELQNTSSRPVPLAGVRFDASDMGIEFTFSETEALGPHEYIVVVRDRNAFGRSYETEGLRIAQGEFENGTALANGGESITLRNARGEVIQQFTYDNQWYRETDGNGFSLVVVDTDADYDDPINWRRSTRIGGSPGSLDPSALLGDTNGDQVVDARDIDLLSAAIRAGDHRFDLDQDGLATATDLAFMVKNVIGTVFGDSNLDGRFDSDDLSEAFQFGPYSDDVTDNASWNAGDWNGDGDFDSEDIVFAFIAGTYVDASA